MSYMKTRKPERHFAVPGKTHLKIEVIYAWVTTEPSGGEGIPAIATETGAIMPLVGADLDRIESFRYVAENMRKHTGYPVRLVRFSNREDLEELP